MKPVATRLCAAYWGSKLWNATCDDPSIMELWSRFHQGMPGIRLWLIVDDMLREVIT